MGHEFMDFDYEDIYETKLERLKYLLHNKTFIVTNAQELSGVVI